MFDGLDDIKQSEGASKPSGAIDKVNLQKAFLDSANSRGIDKHSSPSTFPVELIPMLTLLQMPGSFQMPSRGTSIDPNTLKDSSVFHFPAVKLKDADGNQYLEYNAANPPGLYGIKGKGFQPEKITDKAAESRELYSNEMGVERIVPKEGQPQGEKAVRTVLTYRGRIRDVDGNFFKFYSADWFDANPRSSKFNTIKERKLEFGPDEDGNGPNLRFKGLPAEVGRNIHRITVYKEDLEGNYFNVLIEKFPELRKDPKTGETKMTIVQSQLKIAGNGNLEDLPREPKGTKYKDTTLKKDK